MSGTESPDSVAFDVEVERVECSVKTPTSTPEIVSTFLWNKNFYEIKKFYEIKFDSQSE